MTVKTLSVVMSDKVRPAYRKLYLYSSPSLVCASCFSVFGLNQTVCVVSCIFQDKS